jgi:hypothetical protein
VTYQPSPGIEAGSFSGFVVRNAGHVLKVHFEYDERDSETIHLAREPDGSWLDLDYGVPCEVKLDEQWRWFSSNFREASASGTS